MGRTLSFTWSERRNHGKAEARLALQNSLGESPGWKESDKSRDQWGRGNDDDDDDRCGQDGNHRSGAGQLHSWCFVYTGGGGGGNETSFLGSWGRGGATSYAREVRGKSQKDSSSSELHCDKVNLLLESKSIVQKRSKGEPSALY